LAKTETIYFDDGSDDWWEFRTYLTQATEKGFLQVGMDAQAIPEDDSDDDEDFSAAAEILSRIAKQTNEMIATCTVTWSYPYPITSDSIYNEIPAHHTVEVVERMGDLYSPLLEKSIAKGLQNYSLLSKEELVSPVNG